MKLFGRWSGREESRPALARGASWVPAALGAQGYEAQVREAYLRNPVAQRAVKMVAEGVGGAPLAASDPRIAALVSGRSGGQVLTEVAAAQLLLHGNAYVQVLRDAEGGVAELYALRPERVSVEVDAGGWPVAYRYKVGERAVRLHAEPVRPEMVHLRGFNPVDDHYGMGCLPAASGAVAIHNAASAWNKALLDNAARPSGALVYDPGDGSTLTVEEDGRGLRVEGEIDDPAIAAAVRRGSLPGLSVGYRPEAVRQGAWREISRAALIEVSLVRQPMQPLARVTGVEAG